MVAVEIHTDSPPSEATFVERGVYTGDSNPNRPTYRYTRSGQSYEQEFGSVWLMVFESNGDITGFSFRNPVRGSTDPVRFAVATWLPREPGGAAKTPLVFSNTGQVPPGDPSIERSRRSSVFSTTRQLGVSSST